MHAILAENTVARANGTRAQTPALLRGLIFAPGGHAMTPSHTRKDGKLYRYYVATDAIRQGYAECPVRSVPAAEVEEAVVAQVRHLLRTPEIIARTWAAAKHELEMPEREVVQTVTDFAPLWDELFPAEQARIVRLLVERVDLAPDGMQVRLRAEGLQTLVEELRSREARRHEDEAQDRRPELGIRRLDDHRPHPDDLEAPRRPQGDHRAGRRRRLGAGETTAGRDADPRAGAGASVEADAGGGEVSIGRRRLAEAEGVTRSFVNRLLRLTLLAPDIQEATILENPGFVAGFTMNHFLRNQIAVLLVTPPQPVGANLLSLFETTNFWKKSPLEIPARDHLANPYFDNFTFSRNHLLCQQSRSNRLDPSSH